MAKRKKDDLFTPAEMVEFLRDEILTVNRAAELRLREFAEFVTAYTKGEITPEEANQRWSLHSSRWRDAIHGGLVVSPGGVSDEEIYESIDQHAKIGKFATRLSEERETAGEKKRPGPH